MNDKLLFTPFRLKHVTVKNRICVPPLVVYTWGDETGMVTNRHIAHYRALANGGPGLVIQEATSVARTGRLTPDQLGIWENTQITGLRSIAQVLHSAGLPAIVQLSYAGILSADPEHRVSPSAYRCIEEGEERVSRALTVAEIQIIEQQFIAGAQRAFLAGYDGIELHSCHGYLLSEFLNNRVNRRTDGYNAGDRLILKNIIEGIRDCTPPEFILGCRLGAFEPRLKDGVSNAVWLQAQGVDYISAFNGCDWEAIPDCPKDYPFNESVYGAKCLKQAVSIPIIAVNRIRSGEQAEAILQDTGADMVAVGRGSLVNNRWAADVYAGRHPGSCMDCGVCMWTNAPEKCPGKRHLERSR